MAERGTYGLLAEFETPEALVAATERARKAGYRDIDTFTPFPVYELFPVLRLRDRRVLWLGLFGGILGFALALGMQLFTNWDYPINVGGRPLHSWPSFIPPTFEVTILGAALAAVIGMLAMNGLPRLRHPLFDMPEFDLASRNRFFLCIECADPKFERHTTGEFLTNLQPLKVAEVRR